MIENSKANIIMNSKAEYNGSRIPKVMMDCGAWVPTKYFRGHSDAHTVMYCTVLCTVLCPTMSQLRIGTTNFVVVDIDHVIMIVVTKILTFLGKAHLKINTHIWAGVPTGGGGGV